MCRRDERASVNLSWAQTRASGGTAASRLFISSRLTSSRCRISQLRHAESGAVSHASGSHAAIPSISVVATATHAVSRPGVNHPASRPLNLASRPATDSVSRMSRLTPATAA